MHNKGEAIINIRGKNFKPGGQLAQSPWGGNKLGWYRNQGRATVVTWDKAGQVSGQWHSWSRFSASALLALGLDHSLSWGRVLCTVDVEQHPWPPSSRHQYMELLQVWQPKLFQDVPCGLYKVSLSWKPPEVGFTACKKHVFHSGFHGKVLSLLNRGVSWFDLHF